MSIRIMSAVWETPLADSDKLVLLALADWSDDAGHCWPSIAQLAKKTSKSERTVQAAIRSLTEAGHLSRDEVPGRGCKYRVHPRSDFTPAAAAPRSRRTPAESAPPQGTTDTPAAAAPNTSIHTITSQNAAHSSRSRAKPNFDLPDHIPAEAWSDFVDMRKRIGKPMTLAAMRLAVGRLDKLAADGWPPGDVLGNSILNSYQGLFPPKDDRNGQHQPNLRREPKPDRMVAAYLQACAEERAEWDKTDRDGLGHQVSPRLS